MKTVAGKYEIVKTLGEGGFGTVYLARHHELGDLYAIKLLKKNISEDEELIQRFKREASVIKKLLHPNSVTLRDFGRTEEGFFYMAMDYCQGESMDKILAKEGPMPYQRVLPLMVQILDVVGEAHRLGIFHRDLKPDNIVLEYENKEERAKVLDFGIAKLRESIEKKQAVITQEGYVVGTPMYMSPEQAESREIDERSDIYSLGMVMYAMLAGKPAFEFSTIIQLLRMQIYDYPKRFEELGVNIPREVEALVFKAIQKDPSQRFQNTAEFRNACLEYISTQSWAKSSEAVTLMQHSSSISKNNLEQIPTYAGSVPSVTGSSKVDSPPAPSASGNKALLFLILFLLLGISGVMGYMFFFPHDHLPPKILMESPLQNVSTRDGHIWIRGKVQSDDPNVELKIQDFPVALKEGRFAIKIPLNRDGIEIISLQVKNSAGISDKLDIKVMVDRTPPEILVESPKVPFESPNEHLDILATVKDPSGPVKIFINQKEVPFDGAFLKSHVDLKEGLNTVEIKAVDALGNESKKSLEITGNLDCPLPQILSPKAGTETTQEKILVQCYFPKKAKKILILNEEALPTGEKHYEAQIPLKTGINRVVVHVWDFFGRESQQEITILRKEIPKPEIKKNPPVENPPANLGWHQEKMPKGISKRMKRMAGEPPLRRMDGSVTEDPGEAKEYLRIKDRSVLVFIPAGEFDMGALSEDKDARATEKPSFFVYLDGYYIDKYEITNRQFGQFVQQAQYTTVAEKQGESFSYIENEHVKGLYWKKPWPADKGPGLLEDNPAIHIGWSDAEAYCKWAGADLPSEAQWEKAARGTAKRKYPWGAALPQAGGIFRANFSPEKNPEDDGYAFIAPVGSYEKGASVYGCLDMSGNVFEWCKDQWGENAYLNYKKSQQGNEALKNIFNPGSPEDKKVIRGGAWTSSPISLRVAYRFWGGPTASADNLGFRCIVPLPKESPKSEK